MLLARNREAWEAKLAGHANMTIAAALDALAPIGPPPNLLRRLEFDLKSIDERIEISPFGLSLPKDLTHENWLAVGAILAALEIGHCGNGGAP
jgi:hypothetical protein